MTSEGWTDSGSDVDWSADVVLNDGGTVHVRPIEPSDATALQSFHARQPFESQYFRYFSAKSTLTHAEAERFSTVDLIDRAALVVLDGDDLIAWASYERLAGRDVADVAFHVDDGHLKRGVATLLLEHLSTIAKAAGIERFTAEVLAENRAMSRVFAHAGWALERSFEDGVVDFAWSLDDTPTLVSNIARREQIADAMSMARLLTPRSIAVIGASQRSQSVGQTVIANVLATAGDRTIIPINPSSSEVYGLPCAASIDDVDPECDIDLAVVAVPEVALANVLYRCARRRVRGAIVVTEVGDDFPLAAVIADARRFGMRIIGPGSMGVALPSADPPLHAHLAVTQIPAGPLAISLQSGSLGASMLERAVRLGVGVGAFVSLGIKADVSGNDLLQYWDDDPSIRAIAMYTETVGNPRRFSRIARRVALRRPIIAVRPGGDALDTALYQQAGVIRVDTVAQMLDVGRVLAMQPTPVGRRVAIVSNSASPARLLLSGLVAAELAPVGPVTPGSSADASSIDDDIRWERLGWSVTAEEFVETVRRRRDDGSADAVVAIYAPPVAPIDSRVVDALSTLETGSSPVPVIAVLLGHDDGPIRPGSTIPNFTFPDEVAAVLGLAARYESWRVSASTAAPPIEESQRSAQHDDVKAIIDYALHLRPGGTLLPHSATAELLAALGIPFAAGSAVTTNDDAVAAAERLGYPVALKSNVRPRPVRGFDGGVVLDLRDAHDVRQAWGDLDHIVVGGLREATVQVVVPAGIECRIRGTVHPSLGPVISFGLGGVFADSLGDTVTRLVPLGLAMAIEMVESSQAGEVIHDLGASITDIAQLIVNVAGAMDAHDDLGEIDLNPVIASASSRWVTDSVVRVKRANRPQAPTRKLT